IHCEQIWPLAQSVHRGFDPLARRRPNASRIVEEPREGRTRNPARDREFLHRANAFRQSRSPVVHEKSVHTFTYVKNNCYVRLTRSLHSDSWPQDGTPVKSEKQRGTP